MAYLPKKLQRSRKVTLYDVASPKPSRAASRAVSSAFGRASKLQTETQKKAAAIRAQ